MNRIDSIELRRTLPNVFLGSEKDDPVASSQVWMQELKLQRRHDYLVEAESGTGKSSLCAYIYGSRRDYQGEILFNGKNIREFSINDWCDVRRAHLAYLPQEMRLFAELTAMENIMIKNKLTDRFSQKEIRDMLQTLEIDNKENVVAARLSVGQQQRVAIIRSLCQPFDFILLDEPVSHLDTRNNIIVASLIADVARKNEASIVTTSVGNPLLLRNLQEASNVSAIKL